MSIFLMTEEQKALQEMVRDFVEKEVIPTSAEYDQKNVTNMDAYRKAVEMGLNAIALPEEFGGPGMDHVTQCIILEELYKGDAGFACAVATQTLAAKPVLFAGRDDQKKRVCDLILGGAFGCFCLTEANAGSDAGAICTTAVRDGDDYIINGTKCFISNGPLGEFFVVFALTDKTKGTRGITPFLVERSCPGVSVGKKEDKMGLRQSETSEVIFQDVRVPASAMIGEEGRGYKLAMQVLNHGRIDVGAGAIGIAQHALDLSVKYANERVTFGQTIGNHQAIQFMLADMEIQIEAARSLVWQAAALADAGKISPRVCACAKTMASDTAMRVTTDAVQIYSGFGYSREYPVEKLMRDAKITQIFEGTNQIQRMVIARDLLI